MIYVHEGEVENVLHDYKKSVEDLNSQKELLIHHDPNVTFIQPFREIIKSLHYALTKTHEEIIIFSQDSEKLKLLSSSPSCMYEFNGGLSMMSSAFKRRHVRTRLGDCSHDSLDLKDTKNALLAIASFLKRVI